MTATELGETIGVGKTEPDVKKSEPVSRLERVSFFNQHSGEDWFSSLLKNTRKQIQITFDRIERSDERKDGRGGSGNQS